MWPALVLYVGWDDPGTVVWLPLVVKDVAGEITVVL